MHAIDSVDEIHVETADLSHLLETAYEMMIEIDRDRIEKPALKDLDRVMALMRIARDKCEFLSEQVSDNYGKICGRDGRSK